MITPFIVLQSARCWSDETSQSAVSQLLQGAVSPTHRLPYVPQRSPSPTQSLQGTFFLLYIYIYITEHGFVLNWLIMKCKLQPELAAEAHQTGMIQNVG